MDITPQVINEVEFNQKLRGYDPDEVDDFLERMAAAVGQLQDRLKEAMARATAAEESREAGGAAAPAEAGEAGDASTISRAILAAQRTADALVGEARETAEQMVSEAKQHAQQLATEADGKLDRAVREAEAKAQEMHEAATERLVAELKALEASRDELQSDIAALEAHLDDQRQRLGTAIARLQHVLDDPEAMRAKPSPPVSDARAPDARRSEPAAREQEAAAEEPPVEASSGPGVDDDDGDDDDGRVVTYTVGGDATGRWDVDEQPERPTRPAGSARGAPVGVLSDDDGPAPDMRDDSGGPPTGPYQIVPDASEDAYLDELRKAMAESDEFGPGSGLFDQDQPDALDERPRPRSRFGRRR